MTTIGIIGCGKQAPKHISGLKAAGIKNIVVADINKEISASLASRYEDGSVSSADSVEALLRNENVSGISICTPTKSHAPLIRQAIANDKHYLCEKPLCETLEEAEELVNLTEDSQVTGMVGYIYRFAPAFQKAKEILGDAEQTGVSPVLGKISNAFFRIGGRGSHMAWKHQKATGGGAINEMMVHMLDLSSWLLGPGDVSLLNKNLYWPERVIRGEKVIADTEDYVLATKKCFHGTDVLLQADFITPAFTQYVEIQGENGSFMGSIQNDMPSYVFCSKAAGDFESGKTVFDFPPINMFEAQMAAFVKNIQEGKTAENSLVLSVNLSKDKLKLLS